MGGKRKYPLLKPREVISQLKALGFTFKNQIGSHAHYEKPASAGRERAIVTVDMSVDRFWEDIMKCMIRQSKHTREEFYGEAPKAPKEQKSEEKNPSGEKKV